MNDVLPNSARQKIPISVAYENSTSGNHPKYSLCRRLVIILMPRTTDSGFPSSGLACIHVVGWVNCMIRRNRYSVKMLI